MRHKMVRNDHWMIWAMYGVGSAITCFALIVVLWRGFPDVLSERIQMVVATAFGPAFLAALLLAHLDYLIERYQNEK